MIDTIERPSTNHEYQSLRRTVQRLIHIIANIFLTCVCGRQRARVVNGYDSNLDFPIGPLTAAQAEEETGISPRDIIWLRPHRFKSCRCRFLIAFIFFSSIGTLLCG